MSLVLNASITCTLFSLASFTVGLAFAKVFAVVQARKELEKLHDELNKIRWFGADQGWENAVAAMRTEIAGRIKLKIIEQENL